MTTYEAKLIVDEQIKAVATGPDIAGTLDTVLEHLPDNMEYKIEINIVVQSKDGKPVAMYCEENHSSMIG